MLGKLGVRGYNGNDWSETMDYNTILNDLVSGKLSEFRVAAAEAFAFQAALREFGKRTEIVGRAERGGDVVYTGLNEQ